MALTSLLIFGMMIKQCGMETIRCCLFIEGSARRSLQASLRKLDSRVSA